MNNLILKYFHWIFFIIKDIGNALINISKQLAILVFRKHNCLFEMLCTCIIFFFIKLDFTHAKLCVRHFVHVLSLWFIWLSVQEHKIFLIVLVAFSVWKHFYVINPFFFSVFQTLLSSSKFFFNLVQLNCYCFTNLWKKPNKLKILQNIFLVNFELLLLLIVSSILFKYSKHAFNAFLHLSNCNLFSKHSIMKISQSHHVI